MSYQIRIVSDPKILLGKPVIKGTRIAVELLLKKMSEGASVQDLLNDYPHLQKEDIYAALEYASEL
jgi:uncharacterized protein (DUF433 family)